MLDNDAPLLILAYNRPDHLRNLISSLRPHRPQTITVVVDGPKLSDSAMKQSQEVVREINKIDWAHNLDVLVRPRNMGIRHGIPDAVSWMLKRHERVIVIEDDVQIGNDFLPFMNFMLEKHQEDLSVGHIGGYSRIPIGDISFPSVMSRRSIYPESYAWGTWRRAWEKYDDSLSWALGLEIRELADITGSQIVALAWWINFRDAEAGRIETWAYRWTASLWREKLQSISPTRNLVEYKGQDSGTHTRGNTSWKEQALGQVLKLGTETPSDVDWKADRWASRFTFRGTPLGLLRRAAESVALRFLVQRN